MDASVRNLDSARRSIALVPTASNPKLSNFSSMQAQVIGPTSSHPALRSRSGSIILAANLEGDESPRKSRPVGLSRFHSQHPNVVKDQEVDKAGGHSPVIAQFLQKRNSVMFKSTESRRNSEDSRDGHRKVKDANRKKLEEAMSQTRIWYPASVLDVSKEPVRTREKARSEVPTASKERKPEIVTARAKIIVRKGTKSEIPNIHNCANHTKEDIVNIVKEGSKSFRRTKSISLVSAPPGMVKTELFNGKPIPPKEVASGPLEQQVEKLEQFMNTKFGYDIDALKSRTNTLPNEPAGSRPESAGYFAEEAKKAHFNANPVSNQPHLPAKSVKILKERKSKLTLTKMAFHLTTSHKKNNAKLHYVGSTKQGIFTLNRSKCSILMPNIRKIASQDLEDIEEGKRSMLLMQILLTKLQMFLKLNLSQISIMSRIIIANMGFVMRRRTNST